MRARSKGLGPGGPGQLPSRRHRRGCARSNRETGAEMMTLQTLGARVLATTTVVAIGAAVVPAADAGRPRRCSLAPEEAVFIYRKIVVYEQSNSETRKRFAVCWRPTGVTRGVSSVPLTSAPPPFLSAVKPCGSWVFLEQIAPSGSAARSREVGLSFNVQTGRRGPVVTSTSESLAGPLPDTNGQRRLVSPVVIAGNGDFAWVMDGFPLPGSPGQSGAALYAPDARGGDRALDEGPRGSITGLSVSGTTLNWLHSGQRRQVTLP